MISFDGTALHLETLIRNKTQTWAGSITLLTG